MFKGVEDLQSVGRNQVEAAAATAAALTRDVQQIATEASAFASRSLEDGSAAATRLMGAKSLEGAVRVQADYAKSAFESLLAQAGRMSGLMLAVGEDAAKRFESAMPFGFGGEPGAR